MLRIPRFSWPVEMDPRYKRKEDHWHRPSYVCRLQPWEARRLWTLMLARSWMLPWEVSNKMLKRDKKNKLCYNRGLKCFQQPLLVGVSSRVLDLLKVPWRTLQWLNFFFISCAIKIPRYKLGLIICDSYKLVHGRAQNFFFFSSSHIDSPINNFWNIGHAPSRSTCSYPNCKIGANMFCLISVYIQRNWTLGKTYGIKPKCYCKRLEEPIWEHFGNLMGTYQE